MGLARPLPVTRRITRELQGVAVDRFRERKYGRRFRSVEPGDHFIVAVHFSASAWSSYQLKQWLWPLERLAESLVAGGGPAEPVVVYCRNISMAVDIAAHTELPVRFGRVSMDIDAFFAVNPLRVVFYVNQNLLNFQSIRYPGPAHIHLSHGESEKVSMISNQLKAYDGVFIAGEAARERIQRRLVNMPAERLRAVGRPQLDERIGRPDDWQRDAGRRTVFYAPTWEGDGASMAYSSVARSGEAIVRSFVDAGWQVIYRPHPHTGKYDPATRAAHKRIVRMLSPGNVDRSEAGSRNLSNHYVDVGTPHGWQHTEADACVCDMSAVAFDWLTCGKPLMMMEPSPGAEIDRQGLVGQIPLVPRAEAAGLAALMETELEVGSAQSLRLLAERYFGDTTPGAQIGRFIAESRRMIAERDRQLYEQRQMPHE